MPRMESLKRRRLNMTAMTGSASIAFFLLKRKTPWPQIRHGFIIIGVNIEVIIVEIRTKL